MDCFFCLGLLPIRGSFVSQLPATINVSGAAEIGVGVVVNRLISNGSTKPTVNGATEKVKKSDGFAFATNGTVHELRLFSEYGPNGTIVTYYIWTQQ